VSKLDCLAIPLEPHTRPIMSFAGSMGVNFVEQTLRSVAADRPQQQHVVGTFGDKERKMSQILQTIQDALTEVLEEPVTKLSMATDLLSDLDLDSIRFVQFLLTLEDKIPGLLFNPDTLNQSSFNRVETLIGYIENNRRAG